MNKEQKNKLIRLNNSITSARENTLNTKGEERCKFFDELIKIIDEREKLIASL